MDQYNNKNNSFFHRSLRVVPKEILRRFVEMFLASLILSLIMKFIENSGLIANFRGFIVEQLILFVIFQVLNIWGCLRSSKRMHDYYSRYFVANVTAYILYVFVASMFLYFFGAVRYLTFFGLTIALCFSQLISISYMYKCILLFHIVALIVIVLSNRSGIFRILFRSKKARNTNCILEVNPNNFI